MFFTPEMVVLAFEFMFFAPAAHIPQTIIFVATIGTLNLQDHLIFNLPSVRDFQFTPTTDTNLSNWLSERQYRFTVGS